MDRGAGDGGSLLHHGGKPSENGKYGGSVCHLHQGGGVVGLERGMAGGGMEGGVREGVGRCPLCGFGRWESGRWVSA